MTAEAGIVSYTYPRMDEPWGSMLDSASKQVASRRREHEIAVFTVIFGKYDILHGPYAGIGSYDFYCVTDDPSAVRAPWKAIVVDPGNIDPSKLNRLFKFFPHRFLSGYEKSVYMDGNVAVLRDPAPFLREQGNDSPVLCLRHPQRNCVYEEAEACVAKGKDDANTIRRQMERYRAEGLPERLGLSQNNVIVRRHSDRSLDALMMAWWNELCSESRRDQLGLPYASWRSRVPVALHPDVGILAKRRIERSSLFYSFPHRGRVRDNIRASAKFLQRVAQGAFRGTASLAELGALFFRLLQE